MKLIRLKRLLKPHRFGGVFWIIKNADHLHDRHQTKLGVHY